jgi:hypothetical protein
MCLETGKLLNLDLISKEIVFLGERVSGCQTTRNRSKQVQVNREDVEVSQFPVPPGIP